MVRHLSLPDTTVPPVENNDHNDGRTTMETQCERRGPDSSRTGADTIHLGGQDARPAIQKTLGPRNVSPFLALSEISTWLKIPPMT
jgi:hypothetical protein